MGLAVYRHLYGIIADIADHQCAIGIDRQLEVAVQVCRCSRGCAFLHYGGTNQGLAQFVDHRSGDRHFLGQSRERECQQHRYCHSELPIQLNADVLHARMKFSYTLVVYSLYFFVSLLRLYPIFLSVCFQERTRPSSPLLRCVSCCVCQDITRFSSFSRVYLPNRKQK